MQDQYEVQKNDNLYKIAQNLGLTVEELVELNPQLDDPNAIKPGQMLNVPELEPPEYNQYVIEKGDNLSTIAREHGVTLTALLEINPLLDNPNNLEIGQRINVPKPGAEAYESYAAQVEGRLVNYTIKAGDTLSEIAYDRGLKMDALMRLNGITEPGNIRAGQVIKIPYETTQAVETPHNIYTVKSGDNFSKIAADNGLTERELLRANPDIAKPERLNVGQRLIIPESTNPHRLDKLKPPSETTLAFGVDERAVDAAWDRVEGKSSQFAFQQVSMDRRPLIVIDPGHGAYGANGILDYGADSLPGNEVGLTEVNVVDPVALAMARELSDAGHRVVFARNPGEEYRYSASDPEGRLSSRAKFAHSLEDQTGAPYTVFVSVHANASGSEGANGFEVLVDNSVKGRDGAPTSQHSVALADSVLSEMDGYGGLKNRGMKTYNASVLDTMENGDPGQDPNNPDVAILVELGFLTNERDEAVLADMRENPEEIAGRIAKGVMGYIDSRSPDLDLDEPATRIAEKPSGPVGPGGI